MASLVVTGGGIPNGEFKLDDRNEFRIGRNGSNDICLPFQSVSGDHASIQRLNGRFWIMDRGSKNKTWINGDPLTPFQPQELNDQDIIKICNLRFQFRTEGTRIVVDEENSASTVHHSIGLSSHQEVLETQPTEKLHALLKISNALSKSLDEDQVYSQVADILMRVFKKADRCFVILYNSNTKKLVSEVIRTRTAMPESMVQFSHTIVEKVVVSGEALLFDAAKKMDDSGIDSPSVVESRIRSAIIAPLIDHEGTAFGLIQLDAQELPGKFSNDDLGLLVGIANQAALALENTRLIKIALKAARIEHDMQTARLMQRSFLPADTPKVEGYQFHAYYEPARNVGGDYYDFIADGQKRMGIFVGDVAGKGVTAALVMAKFSGQVQACLLSDSDIARVFQQLNGLMRESGSIGRFITLAASVLDPAAHRVTFISAGHPCPLIYRRATNEVVPVIDRARTGLPLGIEDDAKCMATVVSMEPGDCVIVYTDGISEASDKQNRQFGEAGIIKAVLSVKKQDAAFTPQQIGERIIAKVTEHQAKKEQDDDIALVCFGRLKSPAADAGVSTRVTTASGPLTQTLPAPN